MVAGFNTGPLGGKICNSNFSLRGPTDYTTARKCLESALAKSLHALGREHVETINAVRMNDSSGRVRELMKNELAPLIQSDPGNAARRDPRSQTAQYADQQFYVPNTDTTCSDWPSRYSRSCGKLRPSDLPSKYRHKKPKRDDNDDESSNSTSLLKNSSLRSLVWWLTNQGAVYGSRRKVKSVQVP